MIKRIEYSSLLSSQGEKVKEINSLDQRVRKEKRGGRMVAREGGEGEKEEEKERGRIVIFQEARSEVEKVLKSIIKKGVFHRRG